MRNQMNHAALESCSQDLLSKLWRNARKQGARRWDGMAIKHRAAWLRVLK
jgi:hypothetical protein